MAGQGPSRRQLLQALACASSLAGSAGGFSRWTYAFGEADAQHMHPSVETSARRTKDVYKPRFFTAGGVQHPRKPCLN